MAELIHIFLGAEADTGAKPLANSSFKSSGSLEGMMCGNSLSETKVLEDGCTLHSKGIHSLLDLLFMGLGLFFFILTLFRW